MLCAQRPGGRSPIEGGRRKSLRPACQPIESGHVSGRWWEGAVLYQIYPRSFADANGDGIGDLAGILGRLDHLRGTDASLGVDAIWLSPVHPSPLADFGYDITDYTGIAAEFGTLADLDALIAACHDRSLRLLMDLVPCHTSVEHPWFVESRSSRDDPKRDWYLWADPSATGGPPSNWTSIFGGSAWEWDPATEQFYLHSFYPEQPDLNWRNPAVAEAIADVMRFWLARGVDGFRVDAIPVAIKDDLLRDNPPLRRPGPIPGLAIGGDQDPLWSMNRPEIHDVVRHLRRVVSEFPESRARRRGLPAGRRAGRLSGARRRRRVRPRLRLRAAALAVGAPAPRPRYRARRGAPSAGNVADLRDQQPRPAASRHPLGRRTDAGRGVPAADAAWRGRALCGRGDRHGRRRCLRTASSALRSCRPRRLPHTDAVGCHRWLHDGHAVAAGGRPGHAQRGRAVGGPRHLCWPSIAA